jgi:hypothetical protein
MSPGTRLEKVIIHTMAEMPVKEESKEEAPKESKQKIDTDIPF